jgi:hypothetical protein
MNESYGEDGKSHEEEKPEDMIKFQCLKVMRFSFKHLR